VGISGDARLSDLHTKEPRFVFLPLLQASSGAQTPSAVVLRVNGAWAALQPAIRKAIESLGQDYVTDQRTLGDQVEHSLLRERLLADAAEFFGATAALVVAMGLSGVIGSMVASRTKEIGIRATLGASAAVLRRMVVARALRITVYGVALGLPAAWIAGRWLASALTDVSPHDPLTFALAAFGLMIVSLAAAWLPARRAAGVDPMEALRSE
jgi:predicted lysophospholipase L1 biosynthesis ABC-type transport system permease subunit